MHCMHAHARARPARRAGRAICYTVRPRWARGRGFINFPEANQRATGGFSVGCVTARMARRPANLLVHLLIEFFPPPPARSPAIELQLQPTKSNSNLSVCAGVFVNYSNMHTAGFNKLLGTSCLVNSHKNMPVVYIFSILNYKSFQKYWSVKTFLSLTKIIKRNTKIYNIK